MSQENVEVVCRYWEAWARPTRKATGPIDQFWHPDAVWRSIEGSIDDVGEMHGRDAGQAYIQDWLDTFEDLINVPLEILDAGGDHIVSVQRLAGRAKLSGVETRLEYAVVYTI